MATQPTLGSKESSEQLIADLYVDLRRRIGAWAAVTKQTAQARMGYIGQHLVSVVTGYPGGRSGARGKDLVLPNNESAEIKTCYRVDQLGKCIDCGAGVAPAEAECASCGSNNLKRNDDSKWLIGIQHDEEFSEVLLPKYYYLVLFDFTDLNRPDTIRASIWRVDPLCPGFAYCLIDYYKNIKSASSSGAPFNLWPYSLKFELMRPLLIYQSFVLPDNSIRTRVFPGETPAEHHPLSPLTVFSRSQNLTADKIRDVASRLGVNLPSSTNKRVLLTHLEEARARSAPGVAVNEPPPPLFHGSSSSSLRRDDDTLVDALARALYTPDVQPHLAGLPQKMKDQLATVGLI